MPGFNRFPEKKRLTNRINETIKASLVRVIGPDGEQLGVLETAQALQNAKELELDLVEIAPMANPPVCKIIDWGKFQYQQAKKEKESKKKQQKVEIKGIRLRPRIGQNDLQIRLKQAEKFLSQGNKVRVEILLRGREKAFVEAAKKTLKEEFVDKINFPIKIEQDISRKFNGLEMTIAPISKGQAIVR